MPLLSARVLVASLVSLAVVLQWPGPIAPVAAHSDLLQGSPGPAQQAGGTVDFIDLAFFEPVSNATVMLEDPSGSLVDGTMVVTDGQVIRFEMPPLTEVGRYVVRYTIDSTDGDNTEAAYFFTYSPEAAQPVRIGQPDATVVPPGQDGGTNIGAIIAAAVFLACFIGLAMVMLTKLVRDREARSIG